MPRRPEVRDTAELRRVVSLDRRILRAEDGDRWADILTRELRAPGAPAGARLKPEQALFLVEALANHELGHEYGAWGALPVGAGKTLISWLLAVLLGIKTSVLVVPATLRQKTWDDFKSYVGVWRRPNPPPQVISFEELTSDPNQDMLIRLLNGRGKSLLMIDECDTISDRTTSVPKRIARAVEELGDDVKVIPFSGTPGRLSIMNTWHLLIWALGDRAPVPRVESEALMWASVLDEKQRARRPLIGALEQLEGCDGHSLQSAREAYRRRLAETPGVVILDGDSAADVPLEIDWRIAPEDPELNEHFKTFREEWVTPADWDLSDPLSVWRHETQMGCGWFSNPVPPPPEPWRIARRIAMRFVRKVIDDTADSDHPLDTEAQVFRRYAGHPAVRNWKRIKDTFTPNMVPVWLTASVVQDCIDWLAEEQDTPSIVWCGSVEFGEALSVASGLEYYGAKGLNARGGSLHKAPHDSSFVASWHANKRGFNLQPWRRILIVHPPQSAKYLEQLIGRHHRYGQDQTVRATILITSGGTIDAFEAAVREARFQRSTNGLTQKILRAAITRAIPKRTRSNEYRWATKETARAMRAVEVRIQHGI